MTRISTNKELVTKQLNYLLPKYTTALAELPDVEKRVSEELSELPETEDTKNIKHYVENTKLKNKKSALKRELEDAERTPRLLLMQINNCKFTLALLEQEENFNILEVGYDYYQFIKDDRSTVIINALANINDLKSAIVYRDTLNQKYFLIRTELDTAIENNNVEENLVPFDTLPTFSEFCKIKTNAINSRVETDIFRMPSNSLLKEHLEKADKELEELKTITEDVYCTLLKELYSDLEKVWMIKKSIV